MARRPTTKQTNRGRSRIRGRLGLLLLVPLIALLGVTAFQVSVAAQQSRDATELKAGAELSLATYRLVDAAGRAPAPRGGPAGHGRDPAAVDAAAAEVRARADAIGAPLAAMADRALERTAAAGSLAATSTGGIVAVDGYSPAIDGLLVLGQAGLDPRGAIDDAAASTTTFLASAQEASALERDLITALGADQALVPEEFPAVTELASGQSILASQAALVAAPDLRVRIDRVGDALAGATRSRQALFLTSADPSDVTAWANGATARTDDLRGLRDDASTLAVAAVDRLAASSRQVLVVSTLAVVATLLISALLVRNATRSIAKPLQDLAAQAEEVALSRLPDAVRAQHDDDEGVVRLPALRATGPVEIREVASAFNDVQDTALRLAGEQAVLRRNLSDALTNLGRRNQTLLGRQLDFISSLEKRETDPVFLEHLFKLDHLASRMRRNAESLLVLAGSETPRRRRKPADVTEIVRAAMSEVESFERVRLGHIGRATLGGPVVIDLVHLVAELIENALAFSPPTTTVEIDGRSLGQGGFQLAVIDHGVGMADVELVAANQRLAGLDEVDGVPTRYLGQYVIAKLAAKIGALVRLQPSSGGRGVTAVVSLPASAVMGATDRSNIAQPLPGSRAAREQGPVPFAPGAGVGVGVGADAMTPPVPVIDAVADPFSEPVPELVDTAAPESTEPDPWAVPVDLDTAPAEVAPLDTAPLDTGAAEVVPAETASFEVAPVEDLIPPPPPAPWSQQQAWSIPEQDWTAPVEEPSSLSPVWGQTEAPVTGEPLDAAANVVGEGPFDPAPMAAPGGGLSKRVPGASLADSPLAAPLAEPLIADDRSPDDVRSMLSSFQSGRTRGRDGTDTVTEEQTPPGPPWADGEIAMHEMDAEMANEQEYPSDH